MFGSIRLTNIFIVFIIFIAHFFAPAGYLWTTHTMSELAGQGVPNAWLLTSGFFLAGIGYVGFGIYEMKNKRLPVWLGSLTVANGIFTFFLGVLPTSFDGLIGYPVNETVVVLHRYVAYASNLMTITMITIHAAKSSAPPLKLKHLFFLVFALVFSGFFILYQQEIRGIFQRLILLTTTIWTWTSYGETKPRLTGQKYKYATRSNRQ
jgi:hypothetical membrane protein